MKRKRKRRRREDSSISGRDRAGGTPQESVLLGIYRLMDQAIIKELSRLRGTQGVEPSCRRGCSHCCRQAIPATLPEAHLIAQHIRREFSPREMKALRERMAAWFSWTREDLPALLDAGMGERSAIHEHGPPCPLLDNDECTIHPVRPAICRSHFVSSDPRSCMPRNDPQALQQQPEALVSIHARTQPHVLRIRQYIERLGLDFWESTSQLPRWLAVELGWADMLRHRDEPPSP